MASFNTSTGFTQGTSTGTSQGSSTGGSQGQSTGNSQSSSFVPQQEPQLDFLTQFGNTAGQLGSQQYDWAQDQFAHNSDLTDQNVNSYLQNSDMASQGAQRDFANYNDVYNPAISSLKQDAESYASPDRVNSEMGRSEANVAQNFDAQRANTERGLRSYGINPSDPRYAGMVAANRTAQAASEAGAGTQARLNTEATGRELRTQELNEAHLLPGQAATEQNVSMQGNTGAQNAALANTSTGALTLGTTPNYLNAGVNDVKFSPLGTNSTSTNQSTNSSSNNSTNSSQNQSQNTGQNQSAGQSQSPSSGSGSSGTHPASTGTTGGQQGPGPSTGTSARPANNGTQVGSSGPSNVSVPGTGANASITNVPDSGNGSGAGDQYGPPNEYGPPNPYDTSGSLPMPNDQPPMPSAGDGGQYSTDMGISMNQWQQSGAPDGYSPDVGYAQGGAIPDGGYVPPSMSPSGGAKTDDIQATVDNTGGQAHINAGEFVMPQDTVHWYGHKFFQDLILKARKAMGNPNTAPAKPTMKQGIPEHADGGGIDDISGGFQSSPNTGDAMAPPPAPRPNDMSGGGMPGPGGPATMSRPQQVAHRIPQPPMSQGIAEPGQQPIPSMKNYQAGNTDQSFHPQARYTPPTPVNRQPTPSFTPVARPTTPAPAAPTPAPAPAAAAPTPAPAAPTPAPAASSGGPAGWSIQNGRWVQTGLQAGGGNAESFGNKNEDGTGRNVQTIARPNNDTRTRGAPPPAPAPVQNLQTSQLGGLPQFAALNNVYSTGARFT